MNKQDWIVILIVAIVLAPFFIESTGFYAKFLELTTNHGYIMAFFKFAILAVFGEMLALRIRKGVWYEKGFGVLPRMIVWGILGMGIAMAMVIFKTGVPTFLASVCGADPAEFKAIFGAAELTWGKVGIAFAVSVIMNSIFAPVMMTLHKCTDIHIASYEGSMKCFCHPMKMREIFSTKINWDVQWNLVFKKTIPLFWFPAHTITFCLPGTFQVLFAAALGIALGLILALAGGSKK